MVPFQPLIQPPKLQTCSHLYWCSTMAFPAPSYRDSVFMSAFWRKLFKLSGIKLSMSRCRGPSAVLPHLHLVNYPFYCHENQFVDMPAAICSSRTMLVWQPQRQVFVQRISCPSEESSWEDFDAFCATYPTFNLEDKVSFDGEWDDMSPTVAQAEVPRNWPKRNTRRPNHLKDYV